MEQIIEENSLLNTEEFHNRNDEIEVFATSFTQLIYDFFNAEINE